MATLMGRRNLMLWQAAGCVVCAVVNWRYKVELWEADGGWLTGRLLDFKVIGDLLFVAAVPLTFFFRRVSAVIALFACACCLPLYLLFTTPGPFRRIVGGEWKAPLSAAFVWEWWSIGGIATIAFLAFVCVRVLRRGRPVSGREGLRGSFR